MQTPVCIYLRDSSFRKGNVLRVTTAAGAVLKQAIHGLKPNFGQPFRSLRTATGVKWAACLTPKPGYVAQQPSPMTTEPARKGPDGRPGGTDLTQRDGQMSRQTSSTRYRHALATEELLGEGDGVGVGPVGRRAVGRVDGVGTVVGAVAGAVVRAVEGLF